MTRSVHSLLCALALAPLTTSGAASGEEAAMLAVLSDARRVTPTAEGYQLIAAGGQRQRAVRTMDGGYSVFGTNGSFRLFRTPTGFGLVGPSNDTRRVVMTANGFTVQSSNGWTRILRTGAGWIDPESPEHLRISAVAEGFEASRSPVPPLDGETANARLRQMSIPVEAPIATQKEGVQPSR